MTNGKTALGIGALVALAVGVWWFFLRKPAAAPPIPTVSTTAPSAGGGAVLGGNTSKTGVLRTIGSVAAAPVVYPSVAVYGGAKSVVNTVKGWF